MNLTPEWREFLHLAATIWRFPLFTLENSPITLGQLVAGITLFFFGFFLSRRIARQIEKRFLSRFDLEPAVRLGLRSLIFYFLLMIVVLTVLRLLHVPITVFTVLGGTLAIGLGFGSQNIVNNFVSGLILIMEKPIRVGDFIEIEGDSGTVYRIGARSTILKTPANTHLVIPNSSILERKILNWTLLDPVVRNRLTVGVAYGSNPVLVERVLLEAAGSVPEVLSTPKPFAVFSDFGDNALVFDLYFWGRLDGALLQIQITSLVRHRIYEKLRQAGIEIPFPHRDIHLTLTKPVEISNQA